MRLEEIVERVEGQCFECKSIHINPKALAIPLIAFANADGGTIVIGISDKTRKIEGIDYEQGKLNELLRVPFDYCNPTIEVEVEYIQCIDFMGRDNHLLLMKVESSMDVHSNQADEAFFRMGDKSKKLSFEDRLQLMYDKGKRYFEDSVVPDAELSDLDFDFIEKYIKHIGYGKSAMEYLTQNKGFVKNKAGKYQINAAAILLFGKFPQTFFPRARVRFIKYEGVEEKVGAEMNVIKDVVFEGKILDMVEKSIAFLDTQIKEKTYLGSDGKFVTEEEYPKFVRQEIIVNAVTHRDYSIRGTDIQVKMFDDRIVVESPGRLPGLVKKNNIRNTHFSRNPKIASFLQSYEYVKEFGEGIDRMCKELEACGLDQPDYLTGDFILKAVVRNRVGVEATRNNSMMVKDVHRNYHSMNYPTDFNQKNDRSLNEVLTERNLQKLKPLLDYLEKHDSITPKQAEQVIKKSKSTTYRYLTMLMNAGLITSEGKTSNVVYKKTERYELYN